MITPLYKVCVWFFNFRIPKRKRPVSQTKLLLLSYTNSVCWKVVSVFEKERRKKAVYHPSFGLSPFFQIIMLTIWHYHSIPKLPKSFSKNGICPKLSKTWTKNGICPKLLKSFSKKWHLSQTFQDLDQKWQLSQTFQELQYKWHLSHTFPRLWLKMAFVPNFPRPWLKMAFVRNFPRASVKMAFVPNFPRPWPKMAIVPNWAGLVKGRISFSRVLNIFKDCTDPDVAFFCY